jgi:hypothetical protein
MIYADYPYYSGTYQGKSISEDAFAALARRASLFIDQLTFNRLNAGWPVTDPVRMAACAVAEAMQATADTQVSATYAAGIKSESTDGRSVSYQDADTIRAVYEAQWAGAAEPYLLYTGLMDRGLAPC